MRCRPRRDLGFDVGRVEIEGLVDLRQDRRRAGIDDRRDRGDVGEAGHDHLVAGADPETEQGDPERGRPTTVETEPVADAGQAGDRLLDVMHLGAEPGSSEGP